MAGLAGGVLAAALDMPARQSPAATEAARKLRQRLLFGRDYRELLVQLVALLRWGKEPASGP